ncbi:hypothetical protein MRS44_011579 [Fusarium solani]|uniref:Heterokaryon incompatibility protein-domain-containing protein n=1 Tax=Fusarium solani TaxID=169388 RepID=A0A9P9KTB7_FUSSL|nr:heterokaryon incompatibility protein-domain-containing protein [Fusarium solani]KAH7268136.1 heterokaryon incompatibility protein-domain-containing protein [Fusarium solani]KAJ3460712.1 hypothetical protein MRS44_011579 [Fusarium solani]KAJ4212709.1 hypothetical protein NW759_011349 [Fusarium solani]
MASNIYTPLSDDATSIRIVRLAPSNTSDHISVTAQLIETSWNECSYEALSYCWGRHYRTKTILLNGQQVKVTADLHDALEQFCLEGETRSLWIDAICINQHDPDEKSVQVQRMQDIYRNAKQVLVWIGKEKDHTGLAFEQIQRLLACHDPDAEKEIWNEPGEWIACLNEMIKRPYWSRAWTVQEVVLAGNAILCCGSYTIPFFDFAHLLIRQTTRHWLQVNYALASYLEQVFEMRNPSYQDPPIGLFGLAYKLRLRQCTVPYDRIYAFLGLIKSGKLEELPIDYKMNRDKLWMAFAKATMAKYKTLLPLALAESRYTEARWCYDWDTEFFEPNHSVHGIVPFWTGGLDSPDFYPLQRARHSASDGLEARIRVDLEAPSVISAQGFTVSKVVKVGTCVNSWFISFGRPNYVELFEEWESVVGGPWKDPEMSKRFSQTITGGAWETEPADWRFWNTKNYSEKVWTWSWWSHFTSEDESFTGYNMSRHTEPEPTELHAQYCRIRDDACEERRIFLLENGDFGLGHENTQVGDLVVVLLGSQVPFVLHKRDHGGIGWLADVENKWDLYKSTWGVVGQAYVHSLMKYDGDLEQDIKDEKVVLEEYLLD